MKAQELPASAFHFECGTVVRVLPDTGNVVRVLPTESVEAAALTPKSAPSPAPKPAARLSQPARSQESPLDFGAIYRRLNAPVVRRDPPQPSAEMTFGEMAASIYHNERSRNHG